jgi:hypothetical protein
MIIAGHVITKKLMIPCAHAPAFAPSPAESGISPKACAEEIGYTFLPCVLSYLHRAPSLVSLPCVERDMRGLVCAVDVDSVIVPVSDCAANITYDTMIVVINNILYSYLSCDIYCIFYRRML